MSALKTRILASVTLWFVAVASVAGIAWFAIESAGRQVTAVSVSAPMATDFPDTPTSTSVPNPSSRATSASPKSSSTRSSPKSRPTTTTSRRVKGGAGPTTVTGLYLTSGGRLRVNCRGSQITLAGGYAQPAPGWSVRVQSGGPQRVQVLFELGDQQALVVVAVCAAGRPQFDQHRIEGGSPQFAPTATTADL